MSHHFTHHRIFLSLRFMPFDCHISPSHYAPLRSQAIVEFRNHPMIGHPILTHGPMESAPQVHNHNLEQKKLVGGFNPLKNISQLGLLFPIYGKIKKCSKPPTKLTSVNYGEIDYGYSCESKYSHINYGK